jgi:DNA-binding XRE family transcriptional regulator
MLQLEMAQAIHKSEIVRCWRKETGLSQEEFALEVGAKRQNVNRMETGKRVSLLFLSKVAKRCERPLRDALTENGLQELEKITSLLD